MSIGFFVVSMLAFELFWLILFGVSDDIYGIHSRQAKTCGWLFIFTPIAFFFGFLIWGSF